MLVDAPMDTWDGRLRHTLDEARARGIINDEQRRELVALGTGEPPPTAGGRLRPLVAEAIGYVGGALALVAALVLAEQFWADLRPWARVSLLGVSAASLLAAGMVARGPEGPLARLRGFLWALSAAAVGGTVGVGSSEYSRLTGEEIAFVVGLGVATYGTALWRIRVAGLQQLVVFAGLVTATLAGLAALDPSLASMMGVAAWGLGTAWALLAWAGWIRPLRTGVAAGAAAALLVPFVTSAAFGSGWTLALGLVTAAVLVALSVPLRQTFLLVLGVLGIFLYVPRIIFQYFGETLGAPVSLLLTGIVLVAVALTVARARQVEGGPEGDRGGH